MPQAIFWSVRHLKGETQLTPEEKIVAFTLVKARRKRYYYVLQAPLVRSSTCRYSPVTALIKYVKAKQIQEAELDKYRKDLQDESRF
ncbi:MAG: hypothetical protein R3E08_02335 [Thiotrichaceae bacterium]